MKNSHTTNPQRVNKYRFRGINKIALFSLEVEGGGVICGGRKVWSGGANIL